MRFIILNLEKGKRNNSSNLKDLALFCELERKDLSCT